MRHIVCDVDGNIIDEYDDGEPEPVPSVADRLDAIEVRLGKR